MKFKMPFKDLYKNFNTKPEIDVSGHYILINNRRLTMKILCLLVYDEIYLHEWSEILLCNICWILQIKYATMLMKRK